jgi:MOB kinase activator 1
LSFLLITALKRWCPSRSSSASMLNALRTKLGLSGKGTVRKLRPLRGKNTGEGLISLADVVVGDSLPIEAPSGVSHSEWLAQSTSEAIDATFLLFQVVAPSCTASSCPTMNAGARTEYLWQDKASKEFHTPQRLPACLYISLLHEQAESFVARFFSESHLETSSSRKEDMLALKKLWSRLSRVFGHLFNHHMEDMQRSDSLVHSATFLRWFVAFARHWELVTEEQLTPLKDPLALLGKTK